jgi:hypothetical protein
LPAAEGTGTHFIISSAICFNISAVIAFASVYMLLKDVRFRRIVLPPAGVSQKNIFALALLLH